MGFIRSINEPTVYSKWQGNSKILLLCLYVDDILYMGSSKKMLVEFKEVMMKMLEITDPRPMKYFLCLEVIQRRGSVFDSQEKYVVDLLHKAGMMNCKAIDNPLNLMKSFIHRIIPERPVH